MTAAWESARRRLLRWAVAASLLVATLGMSVWVARLSGTAATLRGQVAELSRPLVNFSIDYIGETTRSVEEEIREVVVTGSHFGLIFRPADLEIFEEYEVRITDADGVELPPIRGFEQSPDGGLRLLLPRSFLAEGDYVARVRGFDGSQWRELSEDRIQIVYSGSLPPS